MSFLGFQDTLFQRVCQSEYQERGRTEGLMNKRGINIFVYMSYSLNTLYHFVYFFSPFYVVLR